MAFFFLIKDDFRQKVSGHSGDSMAIRDTGFIHYIADHPSVINKKNVLLLIGLHISWENFLILPGVSSFSSLKYSMYQGRFPRAS